VTPTAEAPEAAGPEVLSFGCRLNHAESEALLARARTDALGDVILVNSCSVTAQAEREVRKAIRSARRRRPGARIVVTGCAAELAPARWAALAEVDAVLPRAEKQALVDAAPQGFQRRRTRSFLQVQNGCDHRCTFCAIALARGPSRSLPLAAAVAQARAAADAGAGEIVLSGVDLTAWGADLPGRPLLGELAAAILAQVPQLPRLRLSSLDPAEIDEALWRLLADEERLMPHLHLSIQSGDDLVLRRMRRRHRRGDVLCVVERARRLRPDLALGADLIAGFPTESDAAFERTRALASECGLVHLHVFPYSERPGTAAERMPQLPLRVRRERAARLRADGDAARERFLAAKVGSEIGVLEEKNGVGYTPDFAPLRLAEPGLAGVIRRVRVRASTGQQLLE
jgi:threonylcarbamoyladenosine tRNA methylthiotransferase MtaB